MNCCGYVMGQEVGQEAGQRCSRDFTTSLYMFCNVVNYNLISCAISIR